MIISCSKCFPLFPPEVGVYFTSGLSDVTAIIGTDAELVCRLSNEECDGVWYKEGKEVRTKVKLGETSPFKILILWSSFVCFQITATDDICIVKDRNYRKLIIKNCKEEDAGKYRCEADGRKTEAVLKVEGRTLRLVWYIKKYDTM